VSDGPHRRAFEIDGRVIDDSSPCYVIAEVGHNHQGELEQAKQLFDAAKECGADAVKLQKRDNRSLFTKEYYTAGCAPACRPSASRCEPSGTRGSRRCPSRVRASS
jgi:hypothetical protein